MAEVELNLKKYQEAKEWVKYYETHKEEVHEVYRKLGVCAKEMLEVIQENMR